MMTDVERRFGWAAETAEDRIALADFRTRVAFQDQKIAGDLLEEYRDAVKSKRARFFDRLGDAFHSYDIVDFRPFEKARIERQTLFFPSFSKPTVSIVIPTYGHRDLTEACLRSIMRNAPRVSFEILVVDDHFPDADAASFAGIEGLVFIRNPKNLGFLLTCNSAAKQARGTYLCFLNNDTQVLEGWLESLVENIQRRPDCGLIGSKIIYPDGRLQEAGGIVWRDAEACNYGHSGDPDSSEFNYIRKVDYCSGCSILLPRLLFEELGGFDERYVPAYYEDTDLAFRIREKGLEVYYDPGSALVHLEGGSHGTDLSTGVKAYQVANKTKFYERWRHVLERHFAENEHMQRARDRAFNRPFVIVVDHYVPQPDQDAGSRTMSAFLECLVEAGCLVKFWPDSLHQDPGYTEALQELGIEVFYGARWDGKFSEYLSSVATDVDVVLLSRPDVTDRYVNDVRTQTKARVVYYGHDLHFRRLASEPGCPEDRIRDMRALEERAWRNANVVLYPSEAEACDVRTLVSGVDARAITAYAFDSGQTATLEGRQGLIFVAGFAHPPNVDAALYLIQRIMPLVWEQFPEVDVSLVGSNPTSEVRSLASDHVRVTGYVSDAELSSIYRQARLAVVPLNFGAGVKRKVVEALHQGIPLVTTSVGAQGLPGLELVCSVADEPQRIADELCRLLRDDNLWKERSESGRAYVARHFSKDAMKAALLAACGIGEAK